MCFIRRSPCLSYQSGIERNSLIRALPSSITTTGQLPTSALSMPNSSLPHHSGVAEGVLAGAALVHRREHRIGLGRSRLLGGRLPEVHDRGVFPANRAPFARMALVVLCEEIVGVAKVDEVGVQRRIVEVRELEDEAFHELLGGLGDDLVVEIGGAGDDLPLEALLEELLADRVDVVGIAGVEADDLRVLRPASGSPPARSRWSPGSKSSGSSSISMPAASKAAR